MKFSTNEDIAAPIDTVFRRVSDFPGFERQAIRAGADIERTDALDTPGVGMGWKGKFSFRGKTRDLSAQVSRFDAPQGFEINSNSSGLDGQVVVECIPLSAQKTRLNVQVEMRPRTIPARVLVQSLKLAKTALTKRFKRRVSDFARSIEDQA